MTIKDYTTFPIRCGFMSYSWYTLGVRGLISTNSSNQQGGHSDVKYITLFIYIIIIMSCCQHGYPWFSLATPPYRSSLLAGPQGYIPYPHRAAVCSFELVVLLLLSHMRGSIGEHPLWARPCFSSSVLHVWFV